MIILQLYLTLNMKQKMEKDSKYYLQRLGFAQVKAGNTSEHLLNEIRKVICSLHRAKEITKKVCGNIMNSIKL